MAVEKALNKKEQVDLDVADFSNEIELEETTFEEGTVELEDGSVVFGEVEEELEVSEVEFGENIAEYLDAAELARVSNEVLNNFEEDKSSREDWERTYTDGLKYLGMRFDEERSEPFEGASGVVHPLLSESVTQFQAQAYKELLPANGPVKTAVIGDVTPEVEAQAQRVKDYMNYEIMYKMEEYDPDLDLLLFYLPLSGSAFKKVYYDQTLGRAVSKFVPSEDLYVPYGASDLQSSPRVTHLVKMPVNEVRKQIAVGFYKDVSLTVYDNAEEYSDVDSEIDKLTGMESSGSDDIAELLECHTDLDISGFEDMNDEGETTGIKLPYIVTINKSNGAVLSIRRNYKEDDKLKRKINYFVHYKFLPGLGFYGFGLTHMIGSLSKASTSILRQLIDAGTLSNLPGGFKARGIRVRDEDRPIQPGEFRDVDAPGGSLRDALMPLPFKEPSGTLLSLLGLLVESGRRFAAIADMQVGDSNQAMPVGTTVALLERGTKVMSAIHKRMHYAQRIEFKILARIFAESMPEEYPYEVSGGSRAIKRKDFDDRVDVVPVSDPNIFSMSQRIMIAQELLTLVNSNPEIHGKEGIYEAYRKMYDALGVSDPDKLLKKPRKPMPTDPVTENSLMMMDGIPAKAFMDQNHDAHIQAHMLFMGTPLVQQSPQGMGMLQAHIFEHMSMKADLQVDQQLQNPQVRMQMQMMSAEQKAAQREAIKAQILAQQMQEFAQATTPPPQEDPLVALRKQELDIRAADLQRKSQTDQARIQVEAADDQRDSQLEQQRLAQQQNIASEKARIAQERLDQAERFKLFDIQRGR